MYRMELFECSAVTPIPLHLKAGSGIRVTSGRLWLTVEGQSEDVWLRGTEQWIAAQDARVWISAEPVAGFGVLRPVVQVPQRRGGVVVRLDTHTGVHPAAAVLARPSLAASSV